MSLSRALRDKFTQSYVPELKQKGGNKVSKAPEIAKEFQRFYESLYNLEKADHTKPCPQ